MLLDSDAGGWFLSRWSWRDRRWYRFKSAVVGVNVEIFERYLGQLLWSLCGLFMFCATFGYVVCDKVLIEWDAGLDRVAVWP
ncbi:hypothetical protein BT63DRAFT_429605 [Microthyrium microscopicum]|uniref:Uncharacterized protein n=1 Tax=Microthyrium microscopicum TaxID=703497 RepID=A0A6A6TVG4_9PEZI|nr:hypothetical protein BT63DRAFT_429605 [Microthyrium microscopicum]